MHLLCSDATHTNCHTCPLLVLADSGAKQDELEACARITLTSRWGRGGGTVDGALRNKGMAVAEEAGDWAPGGFDITINLAAAGVMYHQPVVSALLSYAEARLACLYSPWVWALPPDPQPAAAKAETGTAAQREGPLPPPTASSAGGTSSSGGGGGGGGSGTAAAAATGMAAAWPPPLPASPESVSEMVLRSFAAHRKPVLPGLSQATTTMIQVACPGVALQLPYLHESRPWDSEAARVPNLFADTVGGQQGERTSMAGGSSSGSRRPPSRGGRGGLSALDAPPLYMFTVMLQNIRVRVGGEDADQLMHSGSVRRTDASAVLDVFSCLSDDTRRAVAHSMIPTRSALNPMLQPASEVAAAVASLELELREVEITGMAKVWAYPEDMPPIMEGIRLQELRGSPLIGGPGNRLESMRLSRELGRMGVAPRGASTAHGDLG
jgi:hypothetical protein